MGSSPLARGTPRLAETGINALGLIPARAGNTGNSNQGTNTARAHPRSRGEHVFGSANHLMGQGSSPLARGTRLGRVVVRYLTGLIPARAGNTPLENIDSYRELGSSPLARGTLLHGEGGYGSPGLIPARAGNTGSMIRAATPTRAHPRSRGEHSELQGALSEHQGSSPLARGTL